MSCQRKNKIFCRVECQYFIKMIPTFLETNWSLIKYIWTICLFSACNYHNNLSWLKKWGSNLIIDFFHVPSRVIYLKDTFFYQMQSNFIQMLTDSEHLQAFQCLKVQKKKKEIKNPTTVSTPSGHQTPIKWVPP